MALSPEGEKVLRAILGAGPDRALGIGRRLRVPAPAAPELYAICELLAKCPREEELQNFLERNVGFLTGLLGTPDNSDLAVLFKPAVGTQYRADFCVLQASQGGALAHLFEIETSHEPLFTQKGNSARRLALAESQIENWRIWINRNPVHFSKELIRKAQEVPLLGASTIDGRGLRLTDESRLEATWSSFGGFNEPYFSYTIIIGRWSDLSSQDKERLISRNRHGNSHLRIFTYEQVARLANFRLERDEWHDENAFWSMANSDEPGS
ncbi:hypothetical protein ABIB99_003135 [Bradyrhizobium sp. LA6.1]|uniref:Shedu anti-phage system protein SduA domain-containing protein n=1 Tax=Bradyrhizobium sp. LA6.1 TaxID=3156378 RepID=UPI0033924AE1